VWTSPGWTEADELSNLIAPNFTGLFDKMRPCGPGDFSKDEKFTVLMGGGYVGILCENGFMDNREDCAKLLDEGWNRELAKAYVVSIYQIMNKWGVVSISSFKTSFQYFSSTSASTYPCVSVPRK
jgi:hypothetical protein